MMESVGGMEDIYEAKAMGFKTTARGLCQIVPYGDPPCNKCAAIEAALREAFERGRMSAEMMMMGAVLVEGGVQ